MLALLAGPSGTTSLCLEAAAKVIPHPAKAKSGGEDAHMILPATGEGAILGAYAVYDGVGAWANEGVDSGLFSRTLATQTALALSAQSWAEALDLTAALSSGLAATDEVGSTTACVLCLERSGRLRALNVGDSGFRVLSGRPTAVKARSTEQTHGFNFPYQLGTGSSTTAQDGATYEFRVAAGDVILLGTDGVFDNVWDERLCALLDEAVEAGAGAAAIAEAVAEEARAAGARSDWQSPFAAAARKYGFSHSGGKLDDVTVVCVKVLDAAAPAIGGPAAAQTRSRL